MRPAPARSADQTSGQSTLHYPGAGEMVRLLSCGSGSLRRGPDCRHQQADLWAQTSACGRSSQLLYKNYHSRGYPKLIFDHFISFPTYSCFRTATCSLFSALSIIISSCKYHHWKNNIKYLFPKNIWKKQNIKPYKHLQSIYWKRGNVQLTMDYWIDIIITLLKIVFLIVVIYVLWTFYQNHTAGLTIEEE